MNTMLQNDLLLCTLYSWNVVLPKNAADKLDGEKDKQEHTEWTSN